MSILQGIIPQSESQPLWMIHGLCLLGDKFEERVFERHKIFIDLKGTALAAYQGNKPVRRRSFTEVTARALYEP